MLEVSESGEIISFNKDYNGSLILEPSYNDTDVLSIGENACQNCKLSSIDMSQTSIILIRTYAFLRSSNLQSIIFPPTLVTINSNAFAHCNIESIYIPASVKTLTGAFNQNLKLNNLIVNPDNTNFVSINNFIFTKNMNTLIRSPINFEFEDIPYFECIRQILTFAMSGSTISRFNASSNISVISSGVFHGCAHISCVDLSLANITEIISSIISTSDYYECFVLPFKTKIINSRAFISNRLTTLIIPSSLEIIHDGAFMNLIALRYIYIYVTSHSFNNSEIFDNTPVSQILCYVPCLYPSDTFGGIPVIRGSFSYFYGQTIPRCFMTKSILPFYTFISAHVFIIIYVV